MSQQVTWSQQVTMQVQVMHVRIKYSFQNMLIPHMRYTLKDDGDVKLKGSIKRQTLFHNLTTRLKYDELYVQVLHNGVSKYLELNALRVRP